YVDDFKRRCALIDDPMRVRRVNGTRAHIPRLALGFRRFGFARLLLRDGRVAHLHSDAVVAMRMELRAFSRRKGHTHDFDEGVLKNELVKWLLLHRNRRLLRETQGCECQREHAASWNAHRSSCRERIYFTETGLRLRSFTTMSSTRCATSHLVVSGTSMT